MILVSRGATAKNKFSILDSSFGLNMNSKRRNRRDILAFDASVCGSFFRIISDEKIFTYNTIGHKIHKSELDFRPGVSRFGFVRILLTDPVWYIFVFCSVKCIAYLRINLKSKPLGKQLGRVNMIDHDDSDIDYWISYARRWFNMHPLIVQLSS